MIPLRIIYFSITYLCIKANVSLKFIQQPETYHDIAHECGYQGGVLVMRGEQAFDEIKEAPEVPLSQEFWVGDLLYSDWILPIDCVRKSAINSGDNNPRNTSQLKQCYKHCMSYPFFAIKKNYCMCLDSYTFQNTPDLSPCNRACDDFGLCGTYDSNPTQYASVYEIHTVVDDNINFRVESPSAYGDNYIECVAANCPSNDYLGVMCNAGLQKKGLCGNVELTSASQAYVSALISCAKETETYYSGVCHNTTKQYVWIGHMRFTFEETDGMTQYLTVARGAKCRKSKMGTTYTVTCIPTTENTALPYVCKTGPQPTTTEAPTTTRKKDGGSTAGIAGGITGAIVAVVVVIIIVFIVSRRKNKNQFACKKEESQDPKHTYAMANGEKYDHVYTETTDVYAETTDIYHPYLEIRENDARSTTSTEYNRNLTNPGYEFPGNSNKGYVQDTNNTAGKLDVYNTGYLDPARTPNFGRKLPQIPSEQNRL